MEIFYSLHNVGSKLLEDQPETIVLDELVDGADTFTKKSYKYLKPMYDDIRFHTGKLELYARVYNIMNYFPEFMHDWIKTEYSEYRTVLQTDLYMKKSVIVPFVQKMMNLAREKGVEKAIKFADHALLTLMNNDTLLTKDFFVDFTSSIKSKNNNEEIKPDILMLINIWEEEYASYYNKAKKEIMSEIQ